MSTPQFPFESENGHQESPPPKRPEFIIIDDTQSRGNREKKENFETFGTYQEFIKERKVEYPIFFRFIFALAALCALGWIIGSTMCLVIFFLFACLTFFQAKNVIVLLSRAWSFLKIAVVSFISAVIAIFSPSLGIGLILLFLALRQETPGETFFQRIIKNYFDKR